MEMYKHQKQLQRTCVTTDESGKTIIKALNEHNHQNDEKKLEAQQLRVQVKRAANSDISARLSKIIKKRITYHCIKCRTQIK